MFTPKMNPTNAEILQNVWKFKLHSQQVLQIHKIYSSKFSVVEIITLLSFLKQENTQENSIQPTYSKYANLLCEFE